MFSISLFDITNTVLLLLWEDERYPDPNIFLCIPASATDADALGPKGIKTLLANSLITFFMVILW